MPRGRPKKVAQAVKMPAEVAAPADEEKASECDCNDADCKECN